MPDDLNWTPDETGLDGDDFPPLDLRADEADDDPCGYCGDPDCDGSCTGARLDDAGEDEAC